MHIHKLPKLVPEGFFFLISMSCKKRILKTLTLNARSSINKKMNN